MNSIIEIKNLNFSYTKNPFLKNINISVNKGEIFGFLGPSGAGKSTLQKILTGLIKDYSGSASVLGIECRNHKSSFYEKIGVDFEFPSVYEKLTAYQNLKYFSSLYSSDKRDIEKLFDDVGLFNDKDKKVKQYSKGMKSRLNFIKALVHNPDVLFLDEPTSGLDPNNAEIMKSMILKEKNDGRTIILTTHNMADAAELCDRVAFIVNGQIKALDTPHNLIMSEGASKLRYTYNDHNGNEIKKEISLNFISEDKTLNELIKKNKITSIHSSEPTLNDIFIKVTGCHLC